jgi:hypothetical protein
MKMETNASINKISMQQIDRNELIKIKNEIKKRGMYENMGTTKNKKTK